MERRCRAQILSLDLAERLQYYQMTRGPLRDIDREENDMATRKGLKKAKKLEKTKPLALKR